jgi:hypothetical protein
MILYRLLLDVPLYSALVNMDLRLSMPADAIRSPSTADVSTAAPTGLAMYVSGDLGSVLVGTQIHQQAPHPVR